MAEKFAWFRILVWHRRKH